MSTSALPHLAPLATRPVMIVEAPKDVPAAALGALRAADLSTITLVHGPDADTPAAIAALVMEGLGKRSNVRGASKSLAADRFLVPTWLAAHRTALVVVAACQHINDTTLDELVNMVTGTASLLLAVDHGYAAHLARAAWHHAPSHIAWPHDALSSADAGAMRTSQADDSESTWPLPETEYWTFLADCRRQLLASTYGQVEHLYLDTVRRVAEWFTDLAHAGIEPSHQAAVHCLRTLIEEQPRFDHVQVVRRAAQAAFHVHGWHLYIEEAMLRHGLLRFPPATDDAALFERLRGLKMPSRACATALHMAGASLDAIRAVTIDDLAQWRHDPTRPVAGIEIPDPAAPFLRAHLIHRLADPPRPDDLAFDGAPRAVANYINHAAIDLGLNFGEANITGSASLAERRIPANTLTLKKFTDHA